MAQINNDAVACLLYKTENKNIMWATAVSVYNCTTDYLVVQLFLVITKGMGIFRSMLFIIPKKSINYDFAFSTPP
jgi:hypothetical protein